MVKSAQDVASDDAAATLNGSAMWGIFLQAEMGPCRALGHQVRGRPPTSGAILSASPGSVTWRSGESRNLRL